MTNTILKDENIKDMAVKIMKNSTWKKPTLRQQIEDAKATFKHSYQLEADQRIKIGALEEQIKSLQNDKRWLQQLLQEMSSTQFMKAKNL